MQQLKFSIIIINYNYSRYLAEAISSALAIDVAQKEVIVVDDGSTDNSAAVIESFGTQIIPVFKTNGGAISCVNKGFRHSSGDIVIFLDADDRIHCDVAKHVLSVWDQEVVKVQYLCNLIDGSGASLGRVQPAFTKVFTQDDVRQSLITSANYPTSGGSANAYARWYLSEILPLPETYPAHKVAAQDNLLNPLAPLYGKVVTLQIPLCDYRRHGENDSEYRDRRPNDTAAVRLDIKRISRAIQRDCERLDFIKEKACDRGIFIRPNALLNCPYHLAAVIVVRKHSYHLSPYQFTTTKLARLTISAVVRYKCIGILEKLTLIAWISCIAIAPRPIALRLGELRYLPNSRPRWTAALLSRFRVKGRADRGLQQL